MPQWFLFVHHARLVEARMPCLMPIFFEVETSLADAKTIRFREKLLENGGLWRDIYGIDEKKVASIIREDKVDILVELIGHTANNKLGTMACQPAAAPIQVTWIGYPNTTGLPTIDYRITDFFADPPDTKQKARILCAVPNSRVVVKCKPFCCEDIKQSFLATLEQLGLESLHVDLLPLILHNHDHMQAYNIMDISLDTFPYAGTTTCKSLYMGVPCITMGGSVHAHNVGVSLLTIVAGLEHLVAKNEDEHVDLALKLASDISAFSNLRMSLWDLMSKSPLCDGLNFAVCLESTYRNMWRSYCKGDMPAYRRLEMLKRKIASEEPSVSKPTEGSPGSIKPNVVAAPVPQVSSKPVHL